MKNESIKFEKGVSLLLEEGVKSEYFYSNRVLGNNSNEVLALFHDNGYELNTIPGTFIKAFTASPKDTEEMSEAIKSIAQLGLKDVALNDLKLSHFKRAFIERLKRCKSNNIPFLNSDNTFIKELNSDEAFNLYFDRAFKNSNPMPRINLADNANNMEQDEMLNARIASMDEFEASIYNSISEKLNYLIIANATNYNLVAILKLAIKVFAEAILDGDYKLSKEEMLGKVLADLGLDIESPEAELILNAVADIQISVERGRIA